MLQFIARAKKNLSGKSVPLLMVFGFLLVGVLFAQPVLAVEWVKDVFGPLILYVIFWPFMMLLNLLTYALLEVAKYNDFANAQIVTVGWLIMRDISNMFFVTILLIIAIGTIVKWDVINYRQNLRRLVLMALLINFSKTIVVFLIDISQIFTLTFISAVEGVLQVGFITALGLNKIANPVTEGVVDATTQAGIGLFTFIMAGIMVAVACLVVAVMVLIFLVRILTLWILIVFSPAAFLASTLPQTKKFYDQWWDMLGKQITIAPVLAFMLWLTFAVISEPGGIKPIVPPGAPPSEGVNASDLIGFATAIGILIYSIRLAVQVGGVGGQLASKMQGLGAATARRVAYGKSGEGGVVGRAKSVGLKTAGGVTGLAAAGHIPFAGRLNETVTIARGQQKEKRKAAEAATLKYLSKDQLEAKEKRSFLGIGTVSAPQRQALIENRMSAMNEKNEKNEFVKTDAEVREAREQYRKSGASEKEMEEFDKKTYLRGLNSERYKDTDAEVISGARKAGEFKNETEGTRVKELMTEMHQEGKMNSDVAARDTITSGELTMNKKSESQMLAFMKDLDSTTKKELVDVYFKRVQELSKDPKAAVVGTAEHKLKTKLEGVIAKSAPDDALKLVTATKGSAAPVEFSNIMSKVEKDQLNQVVNAPDFANNVHLVSQGRAAEILTDNSVTPETRKKFFENLAEKGNEVDAATGKPTEGAKSSVRLYSALAESTATKQEMQNQVAAASATKGPVASNAKTLVDKHTEYTKEQAGRAAQKEIAEAEGKIGVHFSKGQKVKHYNAAGQIEEDWEYEDFDKSTGNVLVKKGKGKPVPVPLSEFRRRNFF